MKKINVSIVIGNPNAECARFGICRIDDIDEDLVPERASEMAAAYGHRGVVAVLSARSEGQVLHLEFPKSVLQPLTLQMFFNEDTFLTEVKKPLPTKLCHALGVAEGTCFAAGQWPIAQTEHAITIAIDAVFAPHIVEDVAAVYSFG
jgi:hypothetical protein